ncbi:MAG: MotA/TolQ/ExbB proton channel family protein [Flavobacteriales bacterium]
MFLIAQNDISILDMIASGGLAGILIIFILLLLSILSISILIEKRMLISKVKHADRSGLEVVRGEVKSGNLREALERVKSIDLPEARMISKGLQRTHKPQADLRQAVGAAGNLEIYGLERNINLLAAIAGAAPMIGFLGTVIGMVIAFHKMANAGGQVDVSMLSDGIYTAMTTTVAGLFVGIVAYLSYNYLVTEIAKLSHRFEATALDFFDALEK